MIDFKATLLDGAYHDVDSSVLAFEIAVRAAFKEGMAKAGPQLPEPIMKVEVVTPDKSLGAILGNLIRRSGPSSGMDHCGQPQALEAAVPPRKNMRAGNTTR